MILNDTWLVGGFKPSEKYDFVHRDDDIPNISGKIIQSCSTHHQPAAYMSKPPFSYGFPIVFPSISYFMVNMEIQGHYDHQPV